MSEQGEFEKWFKNYFHNPIFIDEQCKDELFDSFNAGMQACAERKDKIIEQQAAELAALRKFALDAGAGKPQFKETYIEEAAKKYKLIDESANPTPLLTGEIK